MSQVAAHRSLLGTWRCITTRSSYLPSGEAGPPPFANHPHGTAHFFPERMMAVVGDMRPGAMPAGKERLWAAYAGPYTFDGKTLITKVDLAASVSGDQVRFVSFEGDLMVLSPPPRKLDDGRELKMEFVWEKLEPASKSSL